MFKFFIILSISIVFFVFPSRAHQARCTGTFAIGSRTEPASMEIYSGSLSPERRLSNIKVRVRLSVAPSFSYQSVIDLGGTIIGKQGRTFFIACPSHLVEKIAGLPGVEYCSVSRMPRPLMDSVRSQCRIDGVHGKTALSLPVAYTGKGVLAGIIDTDFDTRHPAFLDPNGQTRFIAIWDQYDSSGAKKNRFGYGTIKFRNELLIDTLFGLGEGSHGTHTSSTMAGSDRSTPYYGCAPDAMLIAVRYAGESEIADGLKWIFSIADSLKLPCVINMSIGLAQGPHDGTSLVDRTIDSLSKEGRIIVGAAGNDGAVYSHILFSLGPNSSKGTFVQPVVDSTEGRIIAYSGADFWGEAGKNFSGNFQLLDLRTMEYRQSSNGFNTSRTRLYAPDTILWTDSGSVCTDTFFMQYGVERSNSNNRKPHMIVYTRSTSPHLLLGITITNSSFSANTVIHGWNISKKSFTDAGLDGFERGDSLYSVNEIGGTAKRIITVGGYTGRRLVPLWDNTIFTHECTEGEAFLSSSLGPTVDGRVKPDITAPAWSVIAALNRNAAHDRPEVAIWPDTSNTFSRYGAETGTSMSSPIVAGIVALMLQADPKLTPEKAKTLLAETAIKDKYTGELTEPSNKWGAGKVNAMGAMERILGITADNKVQAGKNRFCTIRIRGNTILLTQRIFNNYTFELITLNGRKILTKEALEGDIICLPSTIRAGAYVLRISEVNGKTIYFRQVIFN